MKETLAMKYREVLHDDTQGSLARWKAFIRENMVSRSKDLDDTAGWKCFSLVFKDASVFGHSSKHNVRLEDDWLYTCYHTGEN